ncbi:MAG: peroxiredoxin [Planctomycetaceae bacterium]|nr:peroxiredoxin [Planctomycetaceae bacterium]
MTRFLPPVVLLAVACAAPLYAAQTDAAAAAKPQADAKPKEVVLEVGDAAPEFAGRTDEDKPWKSKDHVGKKILVVYFYPADMTGGCTAQACAYRDALAELKRDDVEVVGVSGDSVENHQHFKKAYDLNFTLLADPEGKIAKAFGVKTAPGGTIEREIDKQIVALTRGTTAMRWTFVIGLDKKIAYKDTKVNAAKDSEKVLAVIEKIKPAKSE